MAVARSPRTARYRGAGSSVHRRTRRWTSSLRAAIRRRWRCFPWCLVALPTCPANTTAHGCTHGARRSNSKLLSPLSPHTPRSSFMTSAVNASSSTKLPRKVYDGELTEAEIWWRDHQVWLQECGYMLRPRYRPDWVPSWHKDGGSDFDIREDGQSILVSMRAFQRSIRLTQCTLSAQCNSGRDPHR